MEDLSTFLSCFLGSRYLHPGKSLDSPELDVLFLSVDRSHDQRGFLSVFSFQGTLSGSSRFRLILEGFEPSLDLIQNLLDLLLLIFFYY